MLFDMSASSNSRKIMQLNPEYPKDVTMKSTDGTAVFKAEIAKHGRPDEYTYQWYVNGAAVAEANYEEYERDISGDKGQYIVWCEVTNKAGTVRTRTATLTVNRLPVLDKNYPADASTTIGNACEFKATISEEGYPAEYTYQWYVNGNAVAGATAASFTRTAPAIGTENIYCVVTNKAGTVQSKTAILNVAREDINIDANFVDGGSWGGYISGGAGSVVYENGTLKIYVDGHRTGRAWSTNKYDFTGKNKLVFYCRHFVNQSPYDVATFYFGAGDTQNDDSFIAATAVPGHDADGELVTVDVSNVNGLHYIKITITRKVSNADSVYIEDVWFE